MSDDEGETEGGSGAKQRAEEKRGEGQLKEMEGWKPGGIKTEDR